MTGTLAGKVALVTGASRGIGAEIALMLGQLGCGVAVNYKRSHDRAMQIVDTIAGSGTDAAAFCVDLCSPSASDDLKAAVTARLGSVDILVNNAAHIPRPSDWRTSSSRDIETTVTLNLVATLRNIQAFAPSMAARGWGRIINITSTYAYTGAAEILAYVSAKAGLITCTRSMARELGSCGVTVNAVAPGNIDTEMLDGAPPGHRERVRRVTPLGRLGLPRDIAHAVRFLVEADYVTGHVLVVDGGHILNM